MLKNKHSEKHFGFYTEKRNLAVPIAISMIFF